MRGGFDVPTDGALQIIIMIYLYTLRGRIYS